MIAHAAQFAAAGIPFIFDPGQGLPMFGREDLQRFIEQASWVTVNDYEWSMIQQKTGWSEREVLAHVQALIVTRGAEGSLIHTPAATLRYRRRAPRPSSIRPVAAMPIGPDCCMG